MTTPSADLRQAWPHKPTLTLCNHVVFKAQACRDGSDGEHKVVMEETGGVWSSPMTNLLFITLYTTGGHIDVCIQKINRTYFLNKIVHIDSGRSWYVVYTFNPVAWFLDCFAGPPGYIQNLCAPSLLFCLFFRFLQTYCRLLCTV